MSKPSTEDSAFDVLKALKAAAGVRVVLEEGISKTEEGNSLMQIARDFRSWYEAVEPMTASSNSSSSSSSSSSASHQTIASKAPEKTGTLKLQPMKYQRNSKSASKHHSKRKCLKYWQ